MNKNSLLASIAAAALTTIVANSVGAQESVGWRIIKAISSLPSSDNSADDHDGVVGDRHY